MTITFGGAAEAELMKPPHGKAQTRIHASTANFELFIIPSLIVDEKYLDENKITLIRSF